MASKKRSDGEGSIYQRHASDCTRPKTCPCPWQGAIVTDWRDGKPVRKKVSGKSRAAVATRLREVREAVEGGRLPTGRIPTVREWMTYWLEEVAAKKNRPSTHQAYSTYVNRYIIPLLGDRRLDKLTPEHITAAWHVLETSGCPGKVAAKPLSPTTLHQAHVILSRALKVAQQRGHVTKNAATLMDAPQARNAKIEILTKDQARKVIETAAGKRNAARYTVAFSLGLRQGEALGLRWCDLDLDAGRMTVEHSLGRVKGKGMVLGPVKSRKGARTVAIPKPLLIELRAHRKAQNAERLAAGSWWNDGDFVFAKPDGRPMDQKEDWTAWRLLLAEAKVPMVRLHAARHTAATMLLAMGVPSRVVMEILGHSRIDITTGYQHVLDDLHLDAADKMAAFWD
jgi:integrase